jgi:cytochrome c oxidase subunit 4
MSEHTLEITTAHDSHDGGKDHGHGFTDKKYVYVALILAVLTGIEVLISYVDIGAAFMPTLLFLMALKFWIVVSFFMHLRFDNKLFSWLFYAGLLLAVGVYLAALLTFQFFAS